MLTLRLFFLNLQCRKEEEYVTFRFCGEEEIEVLSFLNPHTERGALCRKV